MNECNATASSSIASNVARGGYKLHNRGWSDVVLVLTSVLAGFWAIDACNGQIEADAFITNINSNSVSVISTPGNAVAVTIPVGLTPIGVTTTPDGRFAYIANLGDNTVSVINVATRAVVSIPLGPSGGQPGGMAISPDGTTVYVTNKLTSTVSVINVATQSVVGSIPLSAEGQPIGIAVTPDGRSAYVANSANNTVSVIDLATNTVTGPPISVGTSPRGVAITPDGKSVYVANNGNGTDGTVSVIDVASKAVVPIVLGGVTGSLGVAITPNGQFAYVTNSSTNTVSVISVTNGTLVGQPIPVGLMPQGVAVTPDGRFVYVANETSNTVSVINVANGTVVPPSILVGLAPEAFGAFIGPNLIVAPGGPLKVANDAALTPLGFGTFVDFNGGTLQTTGSLISSRTISLLALGGTINTNGFNSVFSGTIINSGSLTKIGGGTLTLSGNNSYSGGTNILGGTLSVNNDANLGAPSGGLTFNGGNLQTLASFSTARATMLNAAGGTFEQSAGTIFTEAGTITGIGGLTKIGAGTLILRDNNRYNGGTTVLAGTLQAGSAGGFVSNTIYTVNDGTLDLNGFNLTMSSLNGTGGAVNLGSAALTVNNSAADVYAGVIQGTGSLTKLGTGSLTISGNNLYSGGTFLNAGTLIVNGAQALGLGNVVVNGGVLRADPQPINVKGNYTQNAGGTLQLTLAGSASGQYDVLNVGGRAALDGTLQLLTLGSFQPKLGERLTIVLAAGGVSGQFAQVLDSFSTLVDLLLVYEPNSVLLEFGSSFAAFAQTPNQLTVAKQLDRVVFDPREAQLVSFLQNDSLSNLASDFEKISPDSLSAIYEIGFSGAEIQSANLENRFAEIRNGSTGFTSSLNVTNAPGTMIEGKDGKAVLEPNKNVLTPSPENRWGVWINGSGDFVNVGGDGNGKGYDFATGGVGFGLDYRLTDNLAVGVAMGYAHTWTNLTANGKIDVDNGRGGLYATFSEKGFYLDGYLGGAYNSYSTRRVALGGGASGSTNGGEFDGYVSGGYEFHCGGFTFGPIASLAYTDVGVSGYSESGSLAPLRIVSQSEDSLRTNFGLSASYAWKAGKVQLKPGLRVSWQHEYLYSALPIDAQFASGAGSLFTVNGPDEGHDSALINAGLDVQWTSTIGTYFGYNGEVGRSHYDSHAVICSVQIAF